MQPYLPGLAIPAPVIASGWLQQTGGVGYHAIPLVIAQPIREAVLAGEEVVCWIGGQPIVLGRLSFDHIIPYSYGGATNPANLLPADIVANSTRGNRLDLLCERDIGWKWDLDRQGRRVKVPDYSQRLIRVVTPEGEAVYWSVPKFDTGQLAFGVAASMGVAVAIEGAMQWHAGELRPVDLGTEAGKAAAAYAARYSAKFAVKNLAPRAITFGATPATAELLGSLAGPVGLVAAIYAVEAVEQTVALARRKVDPGQAAKNFVLAPVGAVKDTAELARLGYDLVSPKRRAVRRTRQKWQSITFIPDLNRPDPGEGLATAS